MNLTTITVKCWIHPLQGRWAARELSSTEHHKAPSLFRLCEEAAGFLLLHSSQLKPLCIALESCQFSSLLVFKELQRGSCDSLFQLYFNWKLENIHCHPSHLPAACLCCLELTDSNKIPRNWGRWEEHQLHEVPGTFGAACPADSLLGFLRKYRNFQRNSIHRAGRENLHSQFSKQIQKWHTHQTEGEETAFKI